LGESDLVFGILTVLESALEDNGLGLFVWVEAQDALNLACFDNLVVNMVETVAIVFYQSSRLEQNKKMLHFPYKHLFAIKVHRKYLLTVMDLYLPHGEICLLEILQPSETNPVVEMVEFCHAVEVASDEEVEEDGCD
jgi:hypothetical protein